MDEVYHDAGGELPDGECRAKRVFFFAALKTTMLDFGKPRRAFCLIFFFLCFLTVRLKGAGYVGEKGETLFVVDSGWQRWVRVPRHVPTGRPKSAS